MTNLSVIIQKSVVFQTSNNNSSRLGGGGVVQFVFQSVASTQLVLMNELITLLPGNGKTFQLGHCLRAKAPDGDGKSDCHLTCGESVGEINIAVGSPLLDFIFGIQRS